MISSVTLFAALGVSAVAATLACGAARTFTVRVEPGDTSRIDSSASGTPRAAEHLCLGLACLLALAAFGELWLSRQGAPTALDAPRPAAWGALWVHAFVLIVECRHFGLPGAGRRALAGLLVAGTGVLFLGIGLTTWTNIDPLTQTACLPSPSAGDANAWVVRGGAALGLALVPLAGIALRSGRPEGPPLSAATASVAVAAWLQPALPGLGWLPTSFGAGAALAALLAVALIRLGLATNRGPKATVGALLAYFALSVVGCTVLSIIVPDYA